MEKKNSRKTSSGWTMQGICSQWAEDNTELTINARSIYNTISRYSFGSKKRWCCIPYSKFHVSNNMSIKKAINLLVEKKILRYKHTYMKDGNRGYNEYWLLEPKSMIYNFGFTKYETMKKEEDEEDYNEWD